MGEWLGFFISLYAWPFVALADVLHERKDRRLLAEYEARRIARYEGQ